MRHEPLIVRSGQGDTERVVALHRRCSAHTLWSRCHRAMGDPGSYLGALLSRRGSVHLAVRGPSGRLVAVGHLMPDNGNAEAALLVEDAWQNKGLGTRLLDGLGRSAVEQGWGEVYGLILPGDERMTAMLRRTGVPIRHVREGGRDDSSGADQRHRRRPLPAAGTTLPASAGSCGAGRR
ncbi:GNAT family N-acetyltransferase [Streptomyces canus]|uniref:GNAT family N-acetyltransferase n=1 Tax=Streptomyces canus TaxID=58343 RepID=UPI002781C49F|nr:N-acetyltransferase [Streptomyces canus]MDQ0760323.1 GNAT superfamily N-acetyltransferase [Streptomyces canus]